MNHWKGFCIEQNLVYRLQDGVSKQKEINDKMIYSLLICLAMGLSVTVKS